MSSRAAVCLALPTPVAQAMWRGDALAAPSGQVVASGWEVLDAELPGGGWPCGSLTEVLSPQPSLLEWRLLGGALSQVTAGGGVVVLVGPPKPPFLPGLLQLGLRAQQMVWVQADTPAQRLWATEQLVQTETAGAFLAWLPQARPEQLRRLHSRLQGGRVLCFALRPDSVRGESSPAALRVLAQPGPDWSLQVQLLKRRGPAHAHPLLLPAVPTALQAVLTRGRDKRARGEREGLSAGARHAVVRLASAQHG